MGERGATSAEFEAMVNPHPIREEPTVKGTERTPPVLRLVEEHEIREEKGKKRLFSGAGVSFKKQERVNSQWVEVAKSNEDAFEVDQGIGLMMVADGFGGMQEGEKASAAACAAMRATVRRGLEEPFLLSKKQQVDPRFQEFEPELQRARLFVQETLGLDTSRFASEQDLENTLKNGLVAAHAEVKKDAPNGGTTISSVIIYDKLDGIRRAKIVNRGDSRIYLYRKGELTQLTKDDSFVQVLVDRGIITDDEDIKQSLPASARDYLKAISGEVYPQGTSLKSIRDIVTRGLSSGDKDVEKTPIIDVTLQRGDLLVALTDGVVDNLTRLAIQRVIEHNAGSNPRDIATELARESKAVAHSNDSRAKEDDVTAGVARIEGEVPLSAILNASLNEWKNVLKQVSEVEVIDKQIFELYMVRNQLDIAVEGHAENQKLVALRDHVLARLQLIDSRARELKKSNFGTAITKIG